MKTFLLFLSFLLLSAAASAQRVALNEGWKLSSGNRNMDLPVTVPGTLYGDLLRHGLAADVMTADNEKEIQWIEKGSWVYRNSFEADEAMLQSPHADLVFEGLDTYAKVYVNDSLVITAVNMFREWRVDIAPLLKKGTNHIAVWLLPVEELAAAARKAFPYRLPQTDTAAAAASSLVRKAAYHFGWDWAPRVPDRGIWKPVYIVLRDQISIRRFHVRTISANTTEALLEARFSYISDSAVPACTAQVQGHTSVFEMQKGMGEHAFRFKVKNPKLWWPTGSGEQHLYDFTLKITKGKQAMGSMKARTGIRTIELIRDQDSIGTAFYFKVNGTPVFMKGANYVPPFQWNRSANRLKAVEDAAAVGMNMLRIWGGGIYEDDSFYSLCDEKGILIWQDMMFACSMYPGDGNFLNNVLTEAYETADRLSGHPCLAIWCGNNESDVAWKNWGWQKQYGYSASDSTAIAEAYEKLFLDNIPFGIRAADPYTPYIHTSPLSNWGKRENFNHHNMHYWGVWHGEEAIDSFRGNVPRFMTEYGMQSFPSFNSLTEAFQSDTVSIASPLVASRQKSYKGNRLLESYIKSRYQAPASLEELCYLSQLMQADAMDIAIRSHRLAAGRCMGTLYWQLNDVWPGASWSTIEHQGIWKAAHYKLKELYAPVIIIPVQNKDSIEVYVQNTGPVPVVNGRMSIDVMNLSGDTLKSVTVNNIKSNLQAVKVFQQSVTSLTPEPDNAVLSIRLFSADSLIAQTLHYFVTPDKLKLVKPEISESVSVFNGVTTILLKSDVLAKGVFLSYAGHASHFSDNYFDLLPGVEKKVIFSSEATGELLQIRTYLNGK